MRNKKYLRSIIITIVVGLLIYYFFLPPLNITAPPFWIYIFLLMVTFGISLNLDISNNKNLKMTGLIPITAISILGIIILINFALSPLFNSKAFSERIIIDETKEFTTDIKQVDFKALPLLDKASSRKLGDRVMGQLPELVSQFYVSNLYTQVNYKDDIIRVTPLEYAGFFKYLANRKDGIKSYITVNSVTGESKLIKLDKGMKYMPSAILNENLTRKVRFSYPKDILGEYSFEIDDEGNPFWVIETLKYKGVGIRTEVSGVIVLNPITGESIKYKSNNVPAWIDHVYNPELIVEQVNDWGRYKNGFFNSFIGQKNVVMTTEGYNYTIIEDDVYMYTGITSVSTDEANVGFILTNLRTKETNFYSVPGAEEYSAMGSAEGQVQQMNYKSTFPLLINLNNKPTYLMSLKDNAGLVKMYAFVDVADYQKVVVTDSRDGIEKAAANFLGDDKINAGEKFDKEITINSITSAIIDGNSYYYITDNNNDRYRVSIKINKDLIPFLKNNQKIKISYVIQNEINEILELN